VSAQSIPSNSAKTSTGISTKTPLRVAGPTSNRGLIDTSVAIVLEQLDPSRLPNELAISALTLAELSAGPYAAKSELAHARRQDHLQRVEATLESLDFDSTCARAFGPIYSATKQAGRKPRGARAVDLMIAATARAHGLPLYTLNGADLIGLEGLVEVIDLA